MLIFLRSLLKLNGPHHMTVRIRQINACHKGSGGHDSRLGKRIARNRKASQFSLHQPKEVSSFGRVIQGQGGMDYPNFIRRILFSLRSQMYKYP